jgi:hypothetical protein
MKSFLIPLLAILLSAILASEAHAQSFSIDWFTIAGGGGASTGSVYSISGTIGQPAASGSPMAGGNYSLTGGFWALYAVQTEGAPLLAISLASSAVMVSWSSASTNWILQQNANLNSTNWLTAPETVMDNGTSKYIIVNPPAGNQFYRLFRFQEQ